MVDRFSPSQLTAPSEEITEQGDYLILSFKEAFETLNSIASRLQYDVLLSNGQLCIDDTQLAQVQDQNNNDLSSAAMTENGKNIGCSLSRLSKTKTFTVRSYKLDLLFNTNHPMRPSKSSRHRWKWKPRRHQKPTTTRIRFVCNPSIAGSSLGLLHGLIFESAQ